MEFLDVLPLMIMQWVRTQLDMIMPVWGAEAIIAVIKIILLLAVGIAPVIAFTWAERKTLARAQDRFGPNVAGPYGLVVAFADAIKILTKEDVAPAAADSIVFRLAPGLILVPALLVLAVVPFGRGMVAADLNVGILYAVAMGSVTVLGVLSASWSSRNKYSLVSALRSLAQLVSYEVPMAFALLAVVLASGSLSTVRIVEAQVVPFAISMPLAALIYFLSSLAEANRSPFDMLESESEIVAGLNLEYSGMRFAMFYIAEYLHIFLVAALTTTLFLGGYKGPLLPGWVWFFGKSLLVVFVVLWIRTTWPRIRLDYLLDFAWKFLVPLGMANLVLVAIAYRLASNPYLAAGLSLVGNLVILLLAGGILVLVARRSQSRRLRAVVLGEA
jgi:NADH-quinone oxidoreductase subunit H